jgi:hypothetical protein
MLLFACPAYRVTELLTAKIRNKAAEVYNWGTYQGVHHWGAVKTDKCPPEHLFKIKF